MGDRSVEDFINAYKKSIRYVEVTINEQKISIPITYSMNAAIKYREGYKHGNRIRKVG